MRGRTYVALSALLIALIAGVALVGPSDATAKGSKRLIYEVEATNARLIREVTGDVMAYVDGVPAEPVDSFVWDGDGVTPIRGRVELKVDPVANTGKLKARWTDEYGEWKLTQKLFVPPPHPTGLRVGPSASDTELVMGDPVTTNVYLHGDTTAGGPVLPTVFNHLATWGPAEVTLNGKPFENPFDGPTPLWLAHTMTTVGVRGDDGTVRTVDGDVFNPMVTPANGAVDNDRLEFHLVFHDAPGPGMTGNFPPPLAFFYHLTFTDVEMEIKYSD